MGWDTFDMLHTLLQLLKNYLILALSKVKYCDNGMNLFMMKKKQNRTEGMCKNNNIKKIH